VCCFKLPTALLDYLDLLQGAAAPLSLQIATSMIMIMVEIQYSNTALLFPIKTIAPPLMYLLFEKKTLCCQLCSTRYAAVRINNCFAIKVATFCYKWKPSPQSRHFVMSKDEWDTKEDTDKSMKNALHL